MLGDFLYFHCSFTQHIYLIYNIKFHTTSLTSYAFQRSLCTLWMFPFGKVDWASVPQWACFGNEWRWHCSPTNIYVACPVIIALYGVRILRYPSLQYQVSSCQYNSALRETYHSKASDTSLRVVFELLRKKSSSRPNRNGRSIILHPQKF